MARKKQHSYSPKRKRRIWMDDDKSLLSRSTCIWYYTRPIISFWLRSATDIKLIFYNITLGTACEKVSSSLLVKFLVFLPCLHYVAVKSCIYFFLSSTSLHWRSTMFSQVLSKLVYGRGEAEGTTQRIQIIYSIAKRVFRFCRRSSVFSLSVSAFKVKQSC